MIKARRGAAAAAGIAALVCGSVCIGNSVFAFVRLSGHPDTGLLAPGKAAPAFTLSNPVGGQVSLSKALAGKKAVLVNFWFYA